MINRDEWRWATIWAVVLIVISTLPYLIAYLATPGDLFYAGFLSNPQDGNAYLAKMQQGLRGDWLYRLPYTAEPHKGEFLFTYYILLGHVSRWTRLPLILIFHLARAINGLFLLLVLYYVIAFFLHDIAQRQFAFTITALGSGFGWLAVFLVGNTVDMWVPEGYIFYSIFVNPHFPLAIVLMILAIAWSVTPWGVTRIDWRRLMGLFLCTVALSVVQPFALLTVGVVLLVYAFVRWVQRRRLPRREIVSGAVIGATGLPFVINAYLASVRNPVFAAWSAQNQTLSPPPWDYAISYGIVLLLGLFGLRAAIRRRRDSDLLLLIWTTCTMALLYVPFSLQRRLVMGLIVPLGMLATMGWYALPLRRRPRKVVTWTVASLTTLFLIGLSLFGALTRHELLFLTRDERAALHWLSANGAPDALVIAAPQTGLYIPAWTGQRVFYGHRFDTANAELRQAQLLALFQEGSRTLLQENASPQADYLFYGPRERALDRGNWQPDPAWKVIYQQETVTIYALP
jgi:hypothetical protein